MFRRPPRRVPNDIAIRCAITVAAVAAAGGSAFAEIIDLRASVETRVTEFRQDLATGQESAFDAFPDTADLPLAVLSFVSSRPDFPAGGSAGAALSDPAAVTVQNPGEFAINLSLNSGAGDVRFEGKSRATEERDIIFSPVEVSATVGDTVKLAGRLFFDGVLAVYSPVPTQDLTGNHVTWHVSVTQKFADGSEIKVFDGAFELIGGPLGGAEVRATGDFPQDKITFANGPSTDNPFPAFNIAVVPPISVDFAYDAIVGDKFTLIATMEVSAANAPGLSGVTAIVGAPVETLQTIVDNTFGAPTGPALARAVALEREKPTGELAFPSTPTRALPFACGLLGFESALFFATALGFQTLRRRRR